MPVEFALLLVVSLLDCFLDRNLHCNSLVVLAEAEHEAEHCEHDDSDNCDVRGEDALFIFIFSVLSDFVDDLDRDVLFLWLLVLIVVDVVPDIDYVLWLHDLAVLRGNCNALGDSVENRGPHELIHRRD